MSSLAFSQAARYKMGVAPRPIKNSLLALSLLLLSLPYRANSQPLSLDTSFNPLLNTGAVVYVVAVQPNGRVLIGGTFSSIGGVSVANMARLNTNGTLDTSFNPGAAADIGYVSAI